MRSALAAALSDGDEEEEDMNWVSGLQLISHGPVLPDLGLPPAPTTAAANKSVAAAASKGQPEPPNEAGDHHDGLLLPEDDELDAP